MSEPRKFIEFDKRTRKGLDLAAAHFRYCSHHGYPLIEISGKGEKVEVHWDYFSMDAEKDDVLFYDKVQQLGSEIVYGIFQLVANEKSTLVPGATVGWIRNITIEQARKIALMIFDYLCLAADMSIKD